MIIKKYKLGSILINKLAIQNIKDINHNPYNDIINDKDRRFLFVSDKNRIIKYHSNTKKNINNVYEVLWLYNIEEDNMKDIIFSMQHINFKYKYNKQFFTQ